MNREHGFCLNKSWELLIFSLKESSRSPLQVSSDMVLQTGLALRMLPFFRAWTLAFSVLLVFLGCFGNS
jgi:hypothetical protein